ncbi:spore germination lipoprotein GerD [Bacillus sp. FJAT-27251]|uniref:spore germination lipoprotein GerD n=1 Tax=Bacillus sp. FJAT-27251 TaxID=1684142 RepID=UPI0006A7840F|nr:spore germination lipoprotein GerD [Bacillus sp. FJAT-27251]
MFTSIRLLLPALLLALIAGCAPVETSGEQMDYDETKKMIVDILKTDEGKKALRDLMQDDGIKQNLIMDQAVVSDTIQRTLISEKGTEFWKKSFEDPKFAESVATSMKTEHEKILKDLMKDPEYRSMLIEIFKDPELEKEVMEAMRSNEYRQHMQAVITETFESPLFKAKLQELIIQAAADINKKQDKENSQ